MWALFIKIGDEWKFTGFTKHEEFVTEFEDACLNIMDNPYEDEKARLKNFRTFYLED